VLVVLGAEADLARSLLGDLDGVRTVIAHGWADGLSASLRAGLIHLEDDLDTDRAVITLVDLPDVGSAVVERVLAAATDEHALVRATYGGVPGHPVVLGRRHWRAVSDSLSGDRGAGRYLDLHDCVGVECSDLATGRDVDEPRQT
jgi:CTP:molybdopterin cytidylyltransferase MocA